MSEKPIRQNTIVSTTDKRLTLLQWLKQVQGQLKDLKENGVDMHLLVFNSVQEFYEYFKANYLGNTCELPYLLRYTANPDEASGNDVDYYIYVYGNTYFNIEGDYIEIVVNGPVFQYEYISDECEFCIGASIALYLQTNGTYGLDSVNPITNWYPRYAVDYNEMNRAITTAINNLKTEIDPNLKALYTELASYLKAVNTSKTGKAYGFLQIFKDRTSVLVGNAWKESTDDNTHRHFYGFVAKNDDIYYSTGTGILAVNTGEIENAVSGTQLKEAVHRATQKTYWHSVKIKGANGIFTFNAPSTLNTPVVSTEKLLELFNNDTWAGFGKLGTDMLFAIRLLNGNIEFIKADDTKVSIGAFGTLDISDDVKEVK